MNMRTVLHLIDTTGPGGAETVYTDLIEGLDRARYRSIAVTAGPGWVEDRVRTVGVESSRLAQRGRFAVGYARNLRRLVRSTRADLVHAHLVGAAVYASLSAFGTRTRVLGTVHGHADLPTSDRLARLRYGALRLGADHMVAVSESLRREFVRRSGFPGERTSVIYNGIDLETFRPGSPGAMREQLGLARDEFVFGALGNVRAPKGYDVLLRTAALLASDARPCRVVIVGDTTGDVYPGLVRLHSTLGLGERVIFTGFRRDVPEVLRAFDALVLSSHTEGFSLATVQALATGLPVVATRSGGPQEILRDEVTGLLVPPGDPDALAAAMRRVRDDSALRDRLSAAGPPVARSSFSRSAMIAAYQGLYEVLLGDHPRH